MRKWATLFLCFTLCINLIPITLVYADSNDQLVPDELLDIEVEAMQQIPAMKAHNYLYTELLIDDNGNELFPEWYGGCYINDNNALVIKIVNGNKNAHNLVASVMQEDAEYTFEVCTISLGELDKLAKEVVALGDNSVQSVTLILEDGEITVGVDDVTTFMNRRNTSLIYSSPYINVVQTGETQAMTNLVGGEKLNYQSSEGIDVAGTVGYCGTYIYGNGAGVQPCFLTAGHVVTAGVDLFFEDGAMVEDPYIVQYSNNGYGDYALVPVNDRTITNLVRMNSPSTVPVNSVFYSTNISALAGNQQIYKHGAITGFTTGTILGPSYSETYDGKTIYGLVQFNNRDVADLGEIAQRGDSGGPIWRIDANGNRQLMGIHVGGNATRNYAIYSPIYMPYQNNMFMPKTN